MARLAVVLILALFSVASSFRKIHSKRDTADEAATSTAWRPSSLSAGPRRKVHPLRTAEEDASFKALDSNGDGVISKQEFASSSHDAHETRGISDHRKFQCAGESKGLLCDIVSNEDYLLRLAEGQNSLDCASFAQHHTGCTTSCNLMMLPAKAAAAAMKARDGSSSRSTRAEAERDYAQATAYLRKTMRKVQCPVVDADVAELAERILKPVGPVDINSDETIYDDGDEPIEQNEEFSLEHAIQFKGNFFGCLAEDLTDMKFETVTYHDTLEQASQDFADPAEAGRIVQAIQLALSQRGHTECMIRGYYYTGEDAGMDLEGAFKLLAGCRATLVAKKIAAFAESSGALQTCAMGYKMAADMPMVDIKCGQGICG